MVSRACTGLAVCLTLILAAVPQARSPQQSLISGPSTFTISSSISTTISSSPGGTHCSGPPATLAPGVIRCLTYRIDNQLNLPITVQEIIIDLDPAFPPPPPGCTEQNLALPKFSGSLLVPANAGATSPGLPISLQDTNTNQDACQDTVFHFVFSGTALYGDSTQPRAQRGIDPGTQHERQPGADSLAWTGADVLTVALLACVLTGIGMLLRLAGRRVRGRHGALR